MSDLLPNFLHIGPSKSGSTWLHEVLIGHPEVYLSQAKDLYFFNRYYDRGPGWYRAQFRSALPEHKIIGEVCPDYLSCAEAPERIHACLGPDVRLMVTLREPISRAFSSYLYLAKHGEAAPTFRDTTKTSPELLEEGRYATHLRSYLRYFGRESLHIGALRRPASRPAGVPRRRHRLARCQPPAAEPGAARGPAAGQQGTLAAARDGRQAWRQLGTPP